MLDDNLGIKKVESTTIEKGLCFRAWYERPWEGSFKGYEGVVKVVRSDGKVQVDLDKLVISGATDVLLLAPI